MTPRHLEAPDERIDFECGEPSVDRFLHRYAGQNQHSMGVTWVLANERRIEAFLTVSACSLSFPEPTRREFRLPKYPAPALLIAQLGVDRRFQGRGHATSLLRFAVQLAHHQATATGCVALVVDALPAAVEFYTRFGFRPLSSAPAREDITRMYVALRHLEPITSPSR